jgi:hypothetical protein
MTDESVDLAVKSVQFAENASSALEIIDQHVEAVEFLIFSPISRVFIAIYSTDNGLNAAR